MGMQAVTAAGEYTEAVLTDNFNNIAKGFQSVNAHFRHLEGHVSELYSMVKELGEVQVQVKTSSRIKPFVLGAAVGFVAYRYVKNNERKIEEIQKAAKEQVESFLASNTGAGAPKPQ